jgi:hypothetical protein
MRLNSRTILTLRIPDSSTILCDLPIHHIIPNIPSQQEPLVRDNGISSKRGSLEQIEISTGMQSLLPIVNSNFGVFGGHGGEEGCSELEFYATGDLVVELDFCVEGVDGVPALGQDDAAVGVFAFEFA